MLAKDFVEILKTYFAIHCFVILLIRSLCICFCYTRLGTRERFARLYKWASQIRFFDAKRFWMLLPRHPFVHSSGNYHGRISYRYRFINYYCSYHHNNRPEKTGMGICCSTVFFLAGLSSSLTCLNGKIYF